MYPRLDIRTWHAEELDVQQHPGSGSLFDITTSPTGGSLTLEGPSGHVGGVDWTSVHFFTLDVEHEGDSVLSIKVQFTKGEGNNRDDSIIVHFGILPHTLTRVCFPLSALNAEVLFMPRYPGVLQTVLRGGSGLSAHEVNRVSILLQKSIDEQHVRLGNIQLTTEEPSFPTEHNPIMDELGQYIRSNWSGKVDNAEQLKAILTAEAAKDERAFAGRSRYGGWNGLQFDATGFFRTHHDGRRWWLVDPEGFAFLSTGFDCVHPGESMPVSGVEHLISWLPPKEGEFAPAWQTNNRGDASFSYGIANLIRAFGQNWWTSWVNLTARRHREWGLNTVGNWSSRDFIAESNLPYVWPLNDFPSTDAFIFRDFPDVFHPEYRRRAEDFAKQLEAFINDPLLIGYFLRNEPHFAFVEDLNIAEKMLQSPIHFASKDAFIRFLRNRYQDSIAALNETWGQAWGTFDDLLSPMSDTSKLTPQAREDLYDFSGMMLETYVQIPAEACKRVDPNHLCLGMRYAWISSDHLLRGSKYFDVFSINTYQMKPDENVIKRIHEATGLPVMIGEFHHGALDSGMLAAGLRSVESQRDRGLAYRYFVEQGISMPEMVGMHYFQWNDQPLLGRYDGENYQIGAITGCQQPYADFVREMVNAHESLYKVATGKRQPFADKPVEVPRAGF